tara:strand:+ start:1545 stop:2021 length:477 start_codon:yes stop_codon:yes gene_type:complete
MSVTYTPDPVTPATRGQSFSTTVSFSYSSGTVTSVTATPNDTGDDITLTNSASSFTVSGRYLSGWQDEFYYVAAGESINTASTEIAVNIANMPVDKNLFELKQDMQAIVTKTYSVQVSWTDSELFTSGTTTVTVPHDVINNWEAIRFFMDNYNYNDTN